VLHCHSLLEFLSLILTEEIADQVNFITKILSNVKVALILAVSVRQIPRHVLGAPMSLYMLMPQTNVLLKPLAAQQE